MVQHHAGSLRLRGGVVSMPKRGTTTERGYGSDHQQLREQLLPGAYGQPCPKCGELMHEWQPLDLGHTDDRAGYTGMEHASCNRGHGAAMGNRRRGERRPRVYRGHLSVDVRDL